MPNQRQDPVAESIADDQRRYDVFLSHRFADREMVEALYRRLVDQLGYSVYVDWKVHPELDRSKVDQDTAEHFRRVMRRCGCLIFLAGPNAPGSRWMPWELGFFDGRHGARRIGVYVDDVETFEPGEQEYLGLYTPIDAGTLPGFVEEALDDVAAMTSATTDQWQRHLGQMRGNPADYALSVLQWYCGVSANLLLDPAQLRVNGDGEPSGPLRQPEAWFRGWYDYWRAQQDAAAGMRQQLRSARGRAGGQPDPAAAARAPMAQAVDAAFAAMPSFADAKRLFEGMPGMPELARWFTPNVEAAYTGGAFKADKKPSNAYAAIAAAAAAAAAAEAAKAGGDLPMLRTGQKPKRRR